MDSSRAHPQILVFSEGCISASHGTGAIFLRNFSQYPPERLSNAFIGGGGQDPGLPFTLNLSALRFPGTAREKLAALPARLANRFSRRSWPLPPGRAGIARALQRLPAKPDLLYAICYGTEGLATLEAVIASLPPSTPVLLHIHDFWPSTQHRFDALLRRVVRRCSAIWAITPSIARYVASVAGRDCSVDPGFHIQLPGAYQTNYREATGEFKVILIGNIWNPPLLRDLKAAWQWCQARRPGLPAIRWYCHPDGIAKIRAAGDAPEPELQPQGFLRGSELWSMLAQADLALIPFSRNSEPADDYERYSMPSRVTELAAAGVPIFALAGSSTPLGEYLESHGIGRCVPAAQTEAAGRALLALIDDRAGREAMGRRARALAEAEFGLGEFQPRLYSKLAELAFGAGADLGAGPKTDPQR